MNLKRKQKWAFSLAMSCTMLFSAIGTAAAEPTRQEVRPAIVVDAGSKPAFVTTVEETEEAAKKENKEKNEWDFSEERELETKGEDKEESEEKPAQKQKEKTKNESESEMEEGKQDESEKETKSEAEETEEESKSESETECAEEPEEEPEGESKSESEKELEGESEEESLEKDLPEDAKEELSVDLKDLDKDLDKNLDKNLDKELGAALPVNHIPGVHEHSWSVDWTYDGTYHWHECSGEDCFVSDDSGKEGYGEHKYDEQGVCTDCGYDAMDGIALAAQGAVPTYQEAYEIMIGLKDKYAEGMTWTNFEPYGTKGELGSTYTWNGGAVLGADEAVGCMAFAFILSDAVFDHLPARAVKNFTFEDVKVGDILRVNGNSHSVIVLQKADSGVTVAEANYNKSVHWGRAMSMSAVENADFMITRYPQDYVPWDDPDADEEIETGTAGNLNWSRTRGGVLTISGKGDIPDYSQNSSPWSASDFHTVIIEDGVVSIGDNAFYGNQTLLNVYIPDSVRTIGKNAFSESSLMAVTIPGSVRTIGDSSFKKCANLTSVTVSEGVEMIGASAFYGCTSLAYIDFPASITSVGTAAFMSCENMASVRFMPGSNKVALGDNLFSQCWRLAQVTLPQGADSISDGMFASCTVLPSLYIPASVQSMGTVTGEKPFNSCPNLKVIYFGGSEAQWNSMVTPAFKGSLESNGTEVRFNIVFDDPFAAYPDDPGDFHPDDSGSCTNHVDADNDGKCDNCGASISADTPGTDGGEDNDLDAAKKDPPGSGEGNTVPDAAEKNPSGSGGNNAPAAGSSSNHSSGSSRGGSGGSYKSGGSSKSGGSDNSAVSAAVRWGADGSSVDTRTYGDGTVITTAMDAAGKVRREARLSGPRIRAATENGKSVSLPLSPLQAAKDVSKASDITIYTRSDELVKVAIPVFLPAADTVALMVAADGSANIIKGSLPARNHVVVFLPDGATVKIVNNSKSFSDVPAGSWFEEAVSFISARELFYGTTETAFAPEAPMTYGMAATALAGFDGIQTEGGSTWYEKSMEWADVCGIGKRVSPNPNHSITCEQLVTMLWKYQSLPMEAAGVSGYADAGQFHDTQTAMDWAAKNGILNGFESGPPKPQTQISRGQAAQIIMNFAKKTALDSVQ